VAEKTLAPGDTIGILGGGQLGRMIALAAARLGLKTHIFCPEPASPAFDVAFAHTLGAYDDTAALAAFAAAVDVVTYEFENVPAATAEFLALRRPLRPGVRALSVSQDRIAEKAFLARAGIPLAPYAAVDDAGMIDAALAITGTPAILKTRRLGYDGKGQALVRDRAEAEAALARFGGGDAVLEGVVPFALECSVVAARSVAGDIAVYDIGENRHEHHILKETLVPARIAPATAARARDIATAIAGALDYVGVFAVELFVVRDAGGETLLVNEIAPRVHNSGHWTEDAALTSQFEQHVRAVAGWPLGAATRLADASMVNLIGDEAGAWHALLAEPGARLHLYGKAEARPGRKMGHVNRLLGPMAFGGKPADGG
jgi:5-(carboxyamino)imidazole ribonucleotide synthase